MPADKVTRDYVDLAELALNQSRNAMGAVADADKAKVTAIQAVALALLAQVQKK